MGATSATGTGAGSAEQYNKGPGNNRNIFQTVNGASVVCGGEVQNEGYWQTLVTIENQTESPDNYVVLVTQSDWSNNDGRGDYPPHIEKLDQYGNNSQYYIDDISMPWAPDSVLAGFVLHSATTDHKKFGFMVFKTSGAYSYDPGY